MNNNEKPIVLIGTPFYEKFSHQYVLSSFASIYELYDKYKVALATAESSQIYVNRNVIFKIAYENKVPYLLFIDTDMVWLPKHIDMLIETGKDVIGGLCTTRKVHHKKYCVYEKAGDSDRCTPITTVPAEPFQCYGIGTGFLLIRRDVIKRMWEGRGQHGWPFDPIPHGVAVGKSDVESRYLGEDISFSSRLRKAGIEIWCHPAVRPGHVGEIVLGKSEDEDEPSKPRIALSGGLLAGDDRRLVINHV